MMMALATTARLHDRTLCTRQHAMRFDYRWQSRHSLTSQAFELQDPAGSGPNA